jgi:hypothetical protein
MRELLSATFGLIGKLAVVMAWTVVLTLCIALVIIFPMAVIAGIYWIVCWAFHLVFNWSVPIILGLAFLLTIGMAKIEEE